MKVTFEITVNSNTNKRQTFWEKKFTMGTPPAVKTFVVITKGGFEAEVERVYVDASGESPTATVVLESYESDEACCADLAEGLQDSGWTRGKR